jgi:peptide/nickel transport system substrate-binding protein
MKIAILILILLLALVAGCTSPSSTITTSPTSATSTPMTSATSSTSTKTTEIPVVSGTFIDGDTGGDAETLNWILAADAASFSYVGHTLDSLATYDNNWNVVLRHMAKPLEISADGLTYTVTIRDDLKWSDGQKVTAADYVYTLKNLMFSDWLNYPYRSDWQETVNGETVFVEPIVVNDTTFTIKRQTVDPEFADNAIYGLTPYPEHIAVKYEGDIQAFIQAEEFNNLSYTGNLGPYRFQEWVRNDKFVVSRNPDFYLGQSGPDAGSPFFERFEDKLFGTSAAMQAALEAGDITHCGIEPVDVAKFKTMPGIKVYTEPTAGYDVLVLNQRQNGWEGLRVKEVRQALAMSINKEDVIGSIRLGFADPAFSFIPKPSPWYSDEGVPQFGFGSTYDKEKAKQILAEAGYEVKTVDGKPVLQGRDGNPVKLTLATTPGSSISENMAFLVKQELAGIGIEVEIKEVPWATLLRQYVMNKEPGTDEQPGYNNGPAAVSEQYWDMIVMAFNTNPVAPSGSRVFFTSDGGLNYWGYSSPQVDELYNRVRTAEAIDPKVRRDIYGELGHILADDQAVIFLTFPRGNSGFRSNVAGIDPGMRLSWNYHKWYFAQP